MMQITITRSTELRQEQWDFSLDISYGQDHIYLDGYKIATKETTRHRLWHTQSHWRRIFQRENTITLPPLPPDVEAEMRESFSNKVKGLPIQQ